MRKLLSGGVLVALASAVGNVFAANPQVTNNPTQVQLTVQAGNLVQAGQLGFQIPTFSSLLTFAIRGFFTIAGIAALFFLLQGAFEWVTSGGDKGKVENAQKKMTAAVIGVIMIVVVLAIIWTLENIVFAQAICFGLTCPVTIPQLLTPVTPTPAGQ